MSRISNFCNLLLRPYKLLEVLAFKFGSDKQYLKIWYHNKMGYWMDFNNPKTFNEKLQWLKLYNRKLEYTTMVDKYAVKKYVSDIIGEQYIIPALGVWDSFDEIDFDNLPDQFVLKCTHDSGGLVICKDKSKLDKLVARAKIEASLNTDFYKLGREWPYKNVPRRIIAEEYMEDKETGELRDYKFFCFDGTVKWLFIATDRQNHEEPYFDFFDMNFIHLPMKSGHPNAPIPPLKPVTFDLMVQLCSKLSKNIPHVRIDLYEVNGMVYFGEMTFFHHTGRVQFEPSEWDEIFGKEIILPPKTI